MKLLVFPLIALLAGGAPLTRVQADGTAFKHADGRAFVWRGITAFRLVEFVASGEEAQATAYLDWAARQKMTVVRVFAMAEHLFMLTPADGLRALPRLLELAAKRGIHVEIVALADTANLQLDLDAHVSAVGRIAAQHANALVEIANEPFHPTQHPALHDRATLARLAALIPADVLVAHGSGALESSGGGDYVTVHMPRGEEGWQHVIALAVGRDLVEQYKRPVVSDEPIGAAPVLSPGQRDDRPERFRAAAMLTRMAGMHPTFHYEGGLQARVPSGVELSCFNAWLEGLRQLPAGIERGSFKVLESKKGAAFESRLGNQTWVLTVNGAAPPRTVKLVRAWPASALFSAGAKPPAPVRGRGIAP